MAFFDGMKATLMRSRPFLRTTLLLVASCFAAGASGAESRAFLEVHSRAVSEPMAIRPLTDDFDGRLHSGSVAWTRNHVRAGVRQGAWSVAYVQRYDYLLRFNDDTAELYYQDRNNLGVDSDRDYALRLHAWHLRAQGVQFGVELPLREHWRFDLRLSLLRGMALQEGSAHGVLRADAVNYEGEARLDYRYSEDMLFEHRAPAPDGIGATLDVGIAWRDGKREVALRLADLGGFMHWRDAPFTRAGLDTSGQVIDENVSVPPLLAGVRGLRNHRQRLPVHASLHLAQHLAVGTATLDAEHFLGRVWPMLGFRWDAVPLSPSLGYGFRDGQVSLGVGGAHWRLRLGSDSWRVERARSLTLEGGIGVTF